MARFQSRAFILSAKAYRETSQLLQILSDDHGRIAMVARGTVSPRRKGAPALEPFTLLAISGSLKDRETMGTLHSFEVAQAWNAARRSLPCYAAMNFWFEVAAVLIQPGMPAQEIFEHTIAFLNALETQGHLSAEAWGHFPALLEFAGFTFSLGQCGRCGGTAAPSHVDLASGAVLCPGCAPASGALAPVEPGDMLPARWMFAGQPSPPGARLRPDQLLRLTRLAADFLSHHTDVRLRSIAFLADSMEKG